jgi:hypothetical protein
MAITKKSLIGSPAAKSTTNDRSNSGSRAAATKLTAAKASLTSPKAHVSGGLSSPKVAGGLSSPKRLGGLSSPKRLGGLSSPKRLGGLSSPKAAGGLSSPKLAGGMSSPKIVL